MPAFLNWLLRLIFTNPICMRLVQGGSRRTRHLYIRAGYLAVMIVVLLFVLLDSLSGSSLSMRQLAAGGAQMFQMVSYLQVGLICLLTPVFMAGAIAQEANPRTWDILLTTPLNNLQVVLGNIFGRLFFILALLFSSLPLFAVTQYFGGVPGRAILASYAIAGGSALLVAAIAVTLSVTRTAGRRAVFVFYVTVVIYLFATYAIDLQLRQPVATATISASHTTVMTPLNPFLALEVLLKSNRYVPPDPLEYINSLWITRMWLTRPIAMFIWLSTGISAVLVVFSTLQMRVIGARVGAIPWYRKMFGLSAKGAEERPSRHVGHNPIAWRESVARNRTLGAMLGRWGFVVLGVTIAFTLVGLFHSGSMNAQSLRLAAATLIAAEIVIITLIALNLSATAVSREREDGTLDIILTTPIQPGPYIAGKLRGLIQYLLPLILVPVITMAIFAIYVLADGFDRTGGVELAKVAVADSMKTVTLPVVLPAGAIALPIVLAPFIAFCVMIGLHWSIRSKGTIGSVIAAVAIVLVVCGVLSLCAMPAGRSMLLPGAAFTTVSPIYLVFSMIYPESAIASALASSTIGAASASLVVGAMLAATFYAFIVYAMLANMKRTFMMTVRRLAGTS